MSYMFWSITEETTLLTRLHLHEYTQLVIWWERNARRHGEKPRDTECLIKIVDKNMRLKLLSLKGRGDYFEEGLMTWFGAQQNS